MICAEKRTYVQRLFTRIAPRYDWFNRVASCGLDRRWRRATIRQAGIQPGLRILDVCTGTGDLAVLCARHLGGQGHVIGVDRNPTMLQLARRKPRGRRVPIAWLQGDAEALPFASGSFDRVLIGFSTRNLSDLMTGLQEMVRVLRPGGRLVVLETGHPAHPLMRWGYHAFLSTAARAVGFILTGRLWPFTYLASSVRQFLTPAQFVERLRRLSVDVAYLPLSGGLASLYVATKA